MFSNSWGKLCSKLERIALFFPIAAQTKIELLYTNQYDVHHAVFAES